MIVEGDVLTLLPPTGLSHSGFVSSFMESY